MKKIIELQDATKVIQNGLEEERVILDHVSLSIYEGDFITVLGGNGAGKSTLFNVIAGTLPLTSGRILIHDTDVTNWSPAKRARFISRVFQDPKMGTAPRMTLAENMLVAYYRGEKRNLTPRQLKEKIDYFTGLLKKNPQWLGSTPRHRGSELIWRSTASSQPANGYLEKTGPPTAGRAYGRSRS